MSSEVIIVSISLTCLLLAIGNYYRDKRISDLEDISRLFILYLSGDKDATECVVTMRKEYQQDMGQSAYKFDSGVVSQEGSISHRENR